MTIRTFVRRQYSELHGAGWAVFRQKAGRALLWLLVLLPVLCFFLVMRLLRPWIVIRIVPLGSSRIGHFATNTELYLCERDAGINVPERRFVDLRYLGEKPVANKQLATMWGRRMGLWPAWLLGPVSRLNGSFPGGGAHTGGHNTNSDRDVHNLLERMPPHLDFTAEEELRGRAGLRAMGIPEDAEFVCLVARDSSYLMTPALKRLAPGGNFDYHNYRNSDVQNCVLAAEALADRGYFVIRAGAVVQKLLNSRHPRVIDYATNGMRSDFMDIYLGAKCLFCISSGTGFDGVPTTFRKPIANVNYVPIGYFSSYLQGTVGIFKKHWLAAEKRWLTLSEIFSLGVGTATSSSDYEARGVVLVENTPEEIKSLVIEMLERLKGTWQPGPDDEALQSRFWQIYPVGARDARNKPLHGDVRARYGSQFLRDNRWFLQ